MTGAVDVFVQQLARRSASAAAFLRRKNLQDEDRDDVTQAAIAWCWENRESYSLTTSLDTWFLNAVRDAFKAWRRGALTHSAEALLTDTAAADVTQASAAFRISVLEWLQSLPPAYRRVAMWQYNGKTREEMRAIGISNADITRARKQIKQLQRGLTSSALQHAISTPPPPDYYEGRQRDPSDIDRVIERLDFPPQHGAECPPCWRCKWFEGYLPPGHRSVRMDIVEPEVRDAVRNTEAEKVRIAEEVRDGIV